MKAIIYGHQPANKVTTSRDSSPFGNILVEPHNYNQVVLANLLTSLNLIISKNLKNTAKVFSLELEVFAHTDGKRTMLVHL